MDLVSILVSVVIGLLTLLLTYVLYMSRQFGMFKKLGIAGPAPWPVLGNLGEMMKEGFFKFHNRLYSQYENEKVYGIYEPGRPFIVIKDLDMIKDICIKHFNSFVNRRVFIDEKPFDSVMTNIKDDHWRRVRNSVSPTFSSGKLKRLSYHVEESASVLVSNLKQYCTDGRDVELKDNLFHFAMDVIASTGFGVKIDSLKDKNSPFVTEATKIINGFSQGTITLIMFWPFLGKVLFRLGLLSFPNQSARFFRDFVDKAIANKTNDRISNKRQDFLQLMINAEETSDGSYKGLDSNAKVGLSYNDIQGQSFIFIVASYDNIASVVAFTLFLLAHHPECCQKVQEELDLVLDGKCPNYETIQEMTYLDMCLNETMRMYPPGFMFDRQCNEDCTIQGIHFPKGVYVLFPANAIHHDPNHWPDPEKFDPERFSAEQKENRHPFAHLPFGQGPRNCIGMRLALLQLKIALASILHEMTPVPCEKSVYPVVLTKYQLRAEDGLWVKFVMRDNTISKEEVN